MSTNLQTLLFSNSNGVYASHRDKCVYRARSSSINLCLWCILIWRNSVRLWISVFWKEWSPFIFTSNGILYHAYCIYPFLPFSELHKMGQNRASVLPKFMNKTIKQSETNCLNIAIQLWKKLKLLLFRLENMCRHWETITED